MGTPDILIIDDDQDVRESLMELLSARGYSVHSANNGDAALAWLQSCKTFPKLILLDVIMPVLDGWGFLRERGNDPRILLIPIIMVSGSSGIADQAKRAGATALLPKPVEPDKLLPIVDEFISAA